MGPFRFPSRIHPVRSIPCHPILFHSMKAFTLPVFPGLISVMPAACTALTTLFIPVQAEQAQIRLVAGAVAVERASRDAAEMRNRASGYTRQL